jgi:hypothetical protein
MRLLLASDVSSPLEIRTLPPLRIARSEFYFIIDPSAVYISHAVILICDKGTNDSHLFLAALDTLISIVTDPICQLRMYFDYFFGN